jgi:hypothetical protein
MAGTNFAAAVQALVAERDRQFLMRVSTDYNIPFEELQAKYTETAEAAIKVPRKYTKRDPKAVTVVTDGKTQKTPKAKAEKQCCTSQTSKKEPCKFSALKGEVFCKRHLKQHNGTEEVPVKEPKAAQPVHTHPISEMVNADCDLCQSHGNPLAPVEDFEVVVPSVKTQLAASQPAPSVADRLAMMLEEADSDSESDLGSMTEECYEDE